MYHVIPVTELEHLEPFREAWTRLIQEDPRAQFTQSLEWLESYWKCFGHDKFLECHVVMFGDEPVGFAPLILKKVPTHWGNVRLMTWPLDSWGVGYRPIGRNITSTLFPTFRALHGSNDFDILDLRYLPDDPGMLDRCMSACRLARTPVSHTRWQRFASFSTDCYQHWANYIHRDLEIIEVSRAAHDSLEIERHRPDEFTMATRQLWEHAEGHFDESLVPYLRGCVEGAAKLGMLDLAVASRGGLIEAVVIGHHHGGRYEVLAISPARSASQQAARSWLLGRILLELPEYGDDTALFREEYLSSVGNWGARVGWTSRLTNFRSPRFSTSLLKLSRQWLGAPAPAKRHTIRRVDMQQPTTPLRIHQVDAL